jgi:hypothetical protein
MKIYILPLAVFLALINPTWAHIGETLSELITRYGEKVEAPPEAVERIREVNPSAKKIVRFKKNEIIIDVILIDGRSAQECYSSQEDLKPLDLVTFKKIMEVYAPAFKWKRHEESGDLLPQFYSLNTEKALDDEWRYYLAACSKYSSYISSGAMQSANSEAVSKSDALSGF